MADMNAAQLERMAELHRLKQFRALVPAIIFAVFMHLCLVCLGPQPTHVRDEEYMARLLMAVSNGISCFTYLVSLWISDDKKAHKQVVQLNELNAYLTCAGYFLYNRIILPSRDAQMQVRRHCAMSHYNRSPPRFHDEPRAVLFDVWTGFNVGGGAVVLLTRACRHHHEPPGLPRSDKAANRGSQHPELHDSAVVVAERTAMGGRVALYCGSACGRALRQRLQWNPFRHR